MGNHTSHPQNHYIQEGQHVIVQLLSNPEVRHALQSLGDYLSHHGKTVQYERQRAREKVQEDNIRRELRGPNLEPRQGHQDDEWVEERTHGGSRGRRKHRRRRSSHPRGEREGGRHGRGQPNLRDLRGGHRGPSTGASFDIPRNPPNRPNSDVFGSPDPQHQTTHSGFPHSPRSTQGQRIFPNGPLPRGGPRPYHPSYVDDYVGQDRSSRPKRSGGARRAGGRRDSQPLWREGGSGGESAGRGGFEGEHGSAGRGGFEEAGGFRPGAGSGAGDEPGRME